MIQTKKVPKQLHQIKLQINLTDLILWLTVPFWAILQTENKKLN